MWISVFSITSPLADFGPLRKTSDFFGRLRNSSGIVGNDRVVCKNPRTPRIEISRLYLRKSWQVYCTTPQKSVNRLALHAVWFLPCQVFTKLCDFPCPISGLIQNSNPNFKPGLALHFQNMTRAATQENAFGLCNTQRVLLKGVF